MIDFYRELGVQLSSVIASVCVMSMVNIVVSCFFFN